MIITDIRPLLVVAFPLIAAILILNSGKHPNLREAFSIGGALASVILVFSMVPDVRRGKEFSWTLCKITDTLSLTLRTDLAGILFACVSSFLYLVVIFYAIGYMRGHHEKNQTGFYAFFAICICSAFGIAFADNLLTFFIFFEMLTIATWPLVFHERNAQAKYSGRKYLIYTLIPGQIFLAGIIAVYCICGTLTFQPGGFLQNYNISPGILLLVFFMLIGAGAVKAGMMPFHGWLPSAMVAPTPVSALLHAVAVVKAGAFCCIRIMCYVYGPTLLADLPANQIMGIISVFTIICASLIALGQDNLKRRLAYSTVGQLSYVVLGTSMLSAASLTGAMFHIVAHAVMKITLFMCAGAIIVTTHKNNVSEMRGIGRQMPITMGCYTIAALGIVGLPLTVGFQSKWNLALGALSIHQPVYIVILLASSMLGIAYLLPVTYIAFFSKNESGDFTRFKEADLRMLIPICITAVLVIILGMFPNFGLHLFDIAKTAANAIMH